MSSLVRQEMLKKGEKERLGRGSEDTSWRLLNATAFRDPVLGEVLPRWKSSCIQGADCRRVP